MPWYPGRHYLSKKPLTTLSGGGEASAHCPKGLTKKPPTSAINHQVLFDTLASARVHPSPNFKGKSLFFLQRSERSQQRWDLIRSKNDLSIQCRWSSSWCEIFSNFISLHNWQGRCIAWWSRFKFKGSFLGEGASWIWSLSVQSEEILYWGWEKRKQKELWRWKQEANSSI